MNVTSLYASVCRAALLLNNDDASAWGDLTSLMPYLRRCLGCCACGCVLQEATVAAQCGHSYCRRCGEIGEKPVLRITCKQCRNRDNLVPDEQMRTIVSCYRAVCTLVHTSTISKNRELSMQHNACAASGVVEKLIDEIVQGKSLPSLEILPKTNFPPCHIQRAAEQRREAVARQVADCEDSNSSLVAQLSAGLIRERERKEK
ncbi:E3 ubiquitin-protein ligase MSL2-like [Corticium candelabrum]|uniref:E3 ubiquitin-protein ligase MSL2-like n=1 Tax=Corticium candelabrum TaxID=121492 RepID=UPI002E272AC5|nr:E3 ubiquitin-protein ligase MSL2-like [Corticium candelabrum]